MYNLKMSSCNFNFFKLLTDFRHIILQSAKKTESKIILRNSFERTVLSFLILFVCYETHKLQKEDGRTNLTNMHTQIQPSPRKKQLKD